MGDTTPMREPQRGLTFEDVWAAMMETDRKMRETTAETDRLIKEMAAETDRKMQETDRRMQETDRQIKKTDRQLKETDRQLKETDRRLNKRFGDFFNRFGEIVEYTIAPNLREKFRELHLDFQKTSKDIEISDRGHQISLEIDVFLENSEKALLVEIKTKPTTGDVKDHIRRLEKMRQYADLHGDKRKFLGALAGVVTTDAVKNFALGKGLYVVEPSGETFTITPPKGQPKEW